MRISTRYASLKLGAVVLGTLVASSSASCKSEDDDATSSSCVSTREFFTTEVYGKAMKSCAGCHTPGGAADQAGAKFKLQRDTYPDFVSANLDALRDYVKLDYDGKPLFLLKPLGERDHGGGAVLTEGSEEYKILQKLVSDLRTGNEKSCDGNAQLGVEYLDSRATARKAAITLAGRYPTDDELSSAASDEGLEALVVKLTHEELFYDRLREIWNDALLTERGLDAGVGNTFDNAPILYDDKWPGYTGENRQWTTASVTQEPMRYVDYVVRNDLPFSDIVAGNYLVANPYTAKLYGVPHDKPLAPESFLEWKRIDFAPVQNSTSNEGVVKTTAVPVAGVLTTPAFLNRWETTRTNRGRKRARIVFKNFLATDILKFANRPVDSTALTSVQNPTQNSAQCNVCHRVLDPVAGAFRGFDENNITRFDPADPWHDDMVPPGINGATMPPQDYSAGLMWLGAQIPRDPRFAVAVAQVMYHGIVGDEPLTFPQDQSAPDFRERVRSYSIQSDWFVQIAKEFTENKFDLRRLVAAIVKSAYFRAQSGDTNQDALHDGLGQGRLLTPEMLGRKLRATTGQYFFNNELASKNEQRARDGYLRNDFVEDRDWRLVYGGIDSGDVTKRTDSMSPIMLATAQYTGAMVACRATAFDFTKPADQRRFFRKVDLTTTPFTIRTKDAPTQVPVDGAEGKIRETIAALYFRLLGETLDANSEEVGKVYGLFVDTWKDLENTDFAKPGSNQGLSNYRCAATIDYDAPVTFAPNEQGNLQAQYVQLRARPDKAPYEPGMKLDRDESFTIRSWQAVMTYLLTDYRFTHE
ncbi:MAG: hypothetical protein JWP97_1480 [Labilithrix sp.]|nr:hypothetical protein [Labilithrix sp.]